MAHSRAMIVPTIVQLVHSVTTVLMVSRRKGKVSTGSRSLTSGIIKPRCTLLHFFPILLVLAIMRISLKGGIVQDPDAPR